MPIVGEGSVISLDTAKTVLVPAELYRREGEEREIAEAYLRFNGMELADGEVAVASEPKNGIVAVMGVPADVWEPIRREYEGGEVSVTSPLLSVATGQRSRRGREVNILLTGENACIAVWERGLRMAEVLPDASLDSLLYYMQVLGRQFRLRKFNINVGGRRAPEAVDLLRGYFPHVRVVADL